MKTPRPRPTARTPGSQAHEQLLAAADDLFYREGVRCVGVDTVVAQAGVNKMSLYRQFESKDALVVAYLEQRDALFWKKFEAGIARYADAPKKQLLQFFTGLVKRVSAAGYRGCPFVNVAIEFGDPASPVRELAQRHKERLLGRLTEIAAAAGARQPAELACGLALLIEGCYTASQTYGARHPVLLAATGCATHMIEAATVPAVQGKPNR